MEAPWEILTPISPLLTFMFFCYLSLSCFNSIIHGCYLYSKCLFTFAHIWATVLAVPSFSHLWLPGISFSAWSLFFRTPFNEALVVENPVFVYVGMSLLHLLESICASRSQMFFPWTVFLADEQSAPSQSATPSKVSCLVFPAPSTSSPCVWSWKLCYDVSICMLNVMLLGICWASEMCGFSSLSVRRNPQSLSLHWWPIQALLRLLQDLWQMHCDVMWWLLTPSSVFSCLFHIFWSLWAALFITSAALPSIHRCSLELGLIRTPTSSLSI